MIRRIAIFLLLLLTACKEHPIAKDAASAVVNQSVGTVKKTVVKTLILAPQPFEKEIISQGKMKAKAYSDVTFDLSERIEEVLVQTGQRVKKGQVLARLRDFEWQNQLQKVHHQLEQAAIELESKLISLGYSLQDSINIPPAILKTAQLESNLNGLELERELLRFKLENTKVKAPLSGIVGEVEAQAGNPTSAYKKLCTIIDDQQLQAVFPVLQQELPLVQKGQKVIVRPLHQKTKTYEASISAFLPQVDEYGMVKIFAALRQTAPYLLDGMHVTILIKDQLNDQLVVPKTAIVDRQGKQIVFVYKKGQAHWTYVQIGLENSDTYTILDGLSVGDEVIVDNNFHLSHLEEVERE